VPTAVTGFFGQNVPYPGFGTKAGLVRLNDDHVGHGGDPVHRLQTQEMAGTGSVGKRPAQDVTLRPRSYVDLINFRNESWSSPASCHRREVAAGLSYAGVCRPPCPDGDPPRSASTPTARSRSTGGRAGTQPAPRIGSHQSSRRKDCP
jgi:hypothetical protein